MYRVLEEKKKYRTNTYVNRDREVGDNIQTITGNYNRKRHLPEYLLHQNASLHWGGGGGERNQN